MKTEIRKITPAIAEQILQMNHSNRKIKERVIASYAKEMKKGEWKLTGEAIKISKTKRLLDGQHRLHAIIKSGIPIEMLIISDLDDEIFNVLDTGSNRTASDVLSINRITQPTLTSSIARFIINYNNGVYNSQENNRANRPLNRDIQKFVEENPEVIELSTQVYKDAKKFKLLPASALGGMYYIFSKINTVDAEYFIEKLINGLDLQENCPIRVYRERLIRDQINKTRLTYKEKIVLLINAWNNHRKGKTVKTLRSDNSHSVIAI